MDCERKQWRGLDHSSQKIVRSALTLKTQKSKKCLLSETHYKVCINFKTMVCTFAECVKKAGAAGNSPPGAASGRAAGLNTGSTIL